MMKEWHYFEDIKNCNIQPGCIIGLKYRDDCKKVIFGSDTTVRSGSIIYADCSFGNDFQTGHNVVIREKTSTGSHIVIGTGSVIDGNVDIGDFVKIETNCYIPTHVSIGSRVFIGPGVILTNDRYPQKMRDQYKPLGPTIEDGVSIGGGCVLVPGITIGRGSFIAAGTTVTKDIPPMSFVKGSTSQILALPEKLQEFNMALNWRKYLT